MHHPFRAACSPTRQGSRPHQTPRLLLQGGAAEAVHPGGGGGVHGRRGPAVLRRWEVQGSTASRCAAEAAGRHALERVFMWVVSGRVLGRAWAESNRATISSQHPCPCARCPEGVDELLPFMRRLLAGLKFSRHHVANLALDVKVGASEAGGVRRGCVPTTLQLPRDLPREPLIRNSTPMHTHTHTHTLRRTTPRA